MNPTRRRQGMAALAGSSGGLFAPCGADYK